MNSEQPIRGSKSQSGEAPTASRPVRVHRKNSSFEAMRYTVENCRALHVWLGLDHPDHDLDCAARTRLRHARRTHFSAEVGDWVVRGAAGELWSLGPAVVAASYGVADEA